MAACSFHLLGVGFWPSKTRVFYPPKWGMFYICFYYRGLHYMALSLGSLGSCWLLWIWKKYWGLVSGTHREPASCSDVGRLVSFSVSPRFCRPAPSSSAASDLRLPTSAPPAQWTWAWWQFCFHPLGHASQSSEGAGVNMCGVLAP